MTESQVSSSIGTLPPWFDSVGSLWRIEKIKHHFRFLKSLNSDFSEKTILSLTLRGVVVNDPTSPEGLVPKDYRTYQIFVAGDLVFKLIDLENIQTSRVGIVHQPGAMSSAYIRLHPLSSVVPRFGYWQFMDLYNRHVFNHLGGGVRSTLSASELLNLPFVIPPKEIQYAIVRYLDHAELRIAQAISAKLELLARLSELKGSAISAVLRGNSQDVVETGVPGIEAVPQHWRLRRAKHVWKSVDVRSLTGTEERLSVSSARGIILRSSANVTMFAASSYVGHKIVEPGNLVINSLWAWANGLGISKHHGLVSPVYGVYQLVDDQCDLAFLDFLLRSNLCQWQFQVRSKGIWKSRLSLTDEAFFEIVLPLPPLEEQHEIATKIKAQTASIDAAIESAESEIALLKEYRTRLISEVVTGKIDVRAEAAKLEDIDPLELAAVLAGTATESQEDETDED